MKVPLFLTTLVICSLTAGCASGPFSKKEDTSGTISSPTAPVTSSVKLAAEGKVDSPLTIDVPPWYIKAPESNSEYVFVTGTAVSSSLAMSRSKAMLDAQYQLAAKINGAIDAVARQSRKDNDGKMATDYTSIAIRKKIIETSIAGHHLEDSRILSENRGYRTFVLVRYPLGQANVFLNQKMQQENNNGNQDTDIDKELEKVSSVSNLPVSSPKEISSSATVIPLQPVTDSNGNTISDVKLLDVNNEEYKQKRAEALKKPNAFVGRVTVR